MKTKLKALLHNELFEKLIHKVPFIYSNAKLQKFEALLINVRKAGLENTHNVLAPFEQSIDINVPDAECRTALLKFLPITLVNPPEAWNKYYKKLFKFDNKGKIHVQYPFGVFFNPVSICQYALSVYDTYQQTNEKDYKDLFMTQVTFLLEEGEERENELTFPYRYDFFDMVKGPWVSALAQAQACSVLIRAFILTQDSNYLRLAKKSYNAINDWNKLIVHVNGYEWVEEYPTEKPSCVINGLAWVLISLCELQRFFPDDESVGAALEKYTRTYKENIDAYDMGKGKIRYSLMDEKTVNNSYLGFQCLQMLHLFYYTKDPFFYKQHLKWQSYFDHKEFVSSYLPFNLWNRRLRDISKGK